MIENPNQSINEFISSFEMVFFDFDGTIKESESIKSDAFYELFLDFGDDIAIRVVSHHENNTGVSRFIKLPIYIKWAGLVATENLIKSYSDKFANIVFEKIISSKWVKKVKSYIDNFHNDQIFCVISATPDKELKKIIKELGVFDYFNEILGYPHSKEKAIKDCLCKYNILTNNAVMIGDSFSDYKAAKENNIDFILHRNSLNMNFNFKGRVI